MARVWGVIAIATVALAVTAGSASAVSIPSVPPPPSLPAFSGHAFKGKPVQNTTKPPQNPFMAENPNSNIHNDTWMTDAYHAHGPARQQPVGDVGGRSRRALCGSIAFDTHGRIVSRLPVAIAAAAGPDHRPGHAGDARHLRPARTRPTRPARKTYQNFTGGGYFFLDNKDRIWVADQDRPHLRLQRGAPTATR